MTVIDADVRLTGLTVPPSTYIGVAGDIPQNGIIVPIQRLGGEAFEGNKSEEFDATGNWVWDDGIWIEWDDGEVIEQ